MLEPMIDSSSKPPSHVSASMTDFLVDAPHKRDIVAQARVHPAFAIMVISFRKCRWSVQHDKGRVAWFDGVSVGRQEGRDMRGLLCLRRRSLVV